MLRALYDYALRNDLTIPAGCAKKTIKAYISLNASGDFIGLEMAEGDEPFICPNIGSLANGPDKSNVLVEKISLVLPEKPNKKSQFFEEALRSAAEKEPRVSACVTALNNEQTVRQILSECERHKLKSTDRISFRVGGESLLDMSTVMDWWQEFRSQFEKNGGTRNRCLITGELTTPVETVPRIQGLHVVGGHASGDSLICFDKNSFCSYGLKKSANAPVSEAAFAAVKDALNQLLSDAPILAGMKFVHWYDKPVLKESDQILSLFGGIDAEDDETEEKEKAAAANQYADALINSVKKGAQPMLPPDEYYILLLTGVGGRVMIRRYEHGSYEALQRNLAQWWNDLALTDIKGTGLAKVNKLTAMYMRLLKRQKSDSQPFKRLSKELAGLAPSILTAILTGGPLPSAVAVKALAYIRSMMVDVDDDAKAPPVPDAMCCQWLKVWLLRENRRNHKEELDMVYYNAEQREPAYHCGAMVAIYGEIQRIAMPNVNAGVIQRYYASASQTPALVLGQMARLSMYHLAKFDSPGLAAYYEKLLNQAAVAIGDQVPATLNLEQQAYFALGYRQMCAEMYRVKSEGRAKNQTTSDEIKSIDQSADNGEE